MEHVSEPTASPANALGPLQTRGPRQNQKEDEDYSKSTRIETQDQGKDDRQVRQKEDRVQISREAQDQGRESRVDEGKRNEDNLRPPKEQIENERGAAQKLSDLKNSNGRGERDYDESDVQVESEDPSETRNNRAEETRAQSSETEKTSNEIEKEASDRKNAEVQLREFQNKDEIRIEPKNVSKSVDEIEYQREKAEAAKEPVLEAPSQRIIQAETGTGSESARSARDSVKNDQEGSNKKTPNPVSVQTETGQNVDDLI